MGMDKSRYPDDWEAISRRIRFERAGGKCEWCGAPDGQHIRRYKANLGMWELSSADASEDQEWLKPVKVILTVHHAGVPKPDGSPGDPHDKMDVREENLAALCQRCHLRADIRIHVSNARETRARKKRENAAKVGQLEMF